MCGHSGLYKGIFHEGIISVQVTARAENSLSPPRWPDGGAIERGFAT